MNRTRQLIALILVVAGCSTEKSGGKPLSNDSPSGRVALLVPGSDKSSLTAPDSFNAKFETSKATFVVQVHRAWSPSGADRFYYLVRNGFYDDTRFFRVVPNFMVQFGIAADPSVQAKYRTTIKDDPVKQSNHRGYVSFATAGPNTRTTQVFINYGDNVSLDRSGFSPFGRVVEGMAVVDALYGGYGEGAPEGRGPEQGRIEAQGKAYLDKSFGQLDTIKSTTVLPAGS